MSNNEQRFLELKRQLRQKQENGEQEVIWKLTPEQVSRLRELGYEIMPYIFEIKTKRINNPTSRILQDINFFHKEGRAMLYRSLTEGTQTILKEFGISFIPYKYRIIL